MKIRPEQFVSPVDLDGLRRIVPLNGLCIPFVSHANCLVYSFTDYKENLYRNVPKPGASEDIIRLTLYPEVS